MLDFSMGEIGLIAAIALVVLGPDKLPQVAKTAGSLVRKAQRFVSQVKNDIEKEVEISELKKIQEDARKMATDLEKNLKDTTSQIEKEVKEASDALTSAGQEIQTEMSEAGQSLQSDVDDLRSSWMQTASPKPASEAAAEAATPEVVAAAQDWSVDPDMIDTLSLDNAVNFRAKAAVAAPLKSIQPEVEQNTVAASELQKQIDELKGQLQRLEGARSSRARVARQMRYPKVARHIREARP